MALYDEIGPELIEKILRTFYVRCLDDVMIGYLFFGKDHDALVKAQLSFTIGMLGGPAQYTGRPLAPLHKPMQIRGGHFMRRRQILIETMEEFGLSEAQRQTWVEAEDRLKSLVLKD